MEFNSINNYNPNIVSNQKAGLVQNSQNQQSPAQNQITQQPQQTPTQQINPGLMYDFQAAKMDNETILKYLQNLMKLPNSIDKFVNQLNSKNIDPKITSILIQNMISTKALGEFLNQNSTEAISKLLQTISTSLKSGANDVTQLKEVLAILSTIQTSTLSTNSLKELLLLYIPLNQPVFNKETNFENLDEEEQKKSKNAAISILFETINFSNILCCLNEIDNNLLIDIYSNKNFPNDKFNSIINTLSKEANLNTLIEFKTKKQEEVKNEIQNFKILSDGFISTNSLIFSHLIIKTIFKLDDDFADFC